jgi:carboxymethylenebutenolidase
MFFLTNFLYERAVLYFNGGERYEHGIIDRRTFMSRLAGLAVLDYSMNLLTSKPMPDYAEAEQVSFNDPDIKANSR